MITVAQVKARFPLFSAVDDEVINLMIAEAEGEIGEGWIEAERDIAQQYFVAHLLAVGGFGSSGVGSTERGPVVEETVGPVTRKFASTSGDSGASSSTSLESTSYGQRYLTLLRRSFPTVLGV